MLLASDSLREAPFALRITQRAGGRAAIVYRREAGPLGRDRLHRVGDLPPLAFQAALPVQQGLGLGGAASLPGQVALAAQLHGLG